MDEATESAIRNLHMELVRFGLDADQQTKVLEHVSLIVGAGLSAARRELGDLVEKRKVMGDAQ